MYANSQRALPQGGGILHAIPNPHMLSRSPAMPVLADRPADLSLAGHEIGNAWAQYRQSTVKRYRDGLDFGSVCREWQAAFRAQGSRTGQGFEKVLERLGIPKTTAYRWIKRYETKMRLRTKRNEVAAKHSTKSESAPTTASASKKRFSFHLVLTPAEKQQFDQDVELLGGSTKVVELFLDFVSQKVSHKKLAVND